MRKTFASMAEAKAWRSDAQVALRRGTMSGAKSGTLADAAASWLSGAASGGVRNRSGDVYKPSTLRGYEQALRLRVLPDLGPIALGDIHRPELQAFVDRLLDGDHDPSTIPGDIDVHELVVAAMPDGASDVLTWSLEHPDKLRSVTRSDFHVRGRLGELLRSLGDRRAADVLRRHVSDPEIGEAAVAAIRAIEERVIA